MWPSDRYCGCVATAVRIPAIYPVNFGGFARTPAGERDMSRDYKAFSEASAELDYKHGRQEEAAGQKLDPPPLYRMAKAKARDLLAKGAKDANDLP